ncbi:hypothetical protein HZA57_00440 [Candidatus Poribacteria bacterium]|nr:hypothetical protein [Candidatus Poribacteria bacterium]
MPSAPAPEAPPDAAGGCEVVPVEAPVEPQAETEPPPSRRCRPGWLDWALRASVLVLFLIPAHDFLRVAIGRVGYPFEVEWLEGEIAMYAVRLRSEGSLAALYPAYEAGQYVPHLYPPFYQVLLTALFAATDSLHLGLGRFLSILATLGILAAVQAIVWHHTRDWFAGALGALSYLAFFKPSGYWFDLVRVDSLASCLALWSAYFITVRPGRWWQFALGLILGFLAQFTKQTSVFIPAAALCFRVMWLVFSVGTMHLGALLPAVRRAGRFIPHPRHTLIVLAPSALLLANLVYFLREEPWQWIWFYLYEVPSQHVIYWETIRTRGWQELWQYYSFAAWIVPASVWIALLARRWRPWWPVLVAVALGAGTTWAVHHWIAGGLTLPHPGDAAWGENRPGLLSPAAMRYVACSWQWAIEGSLALTVGGLAAWVVRWVVFKTPLRGVCWIAILIAAEHIAAVTWVKIGGYINNFMPLFAVQSVVLGLCLAWLFRAGRRHWWRHAVMILLAASAWFTWYGTREAFFLAPRVRAAERKAIEAGELQSVPETADVMRYGEGYQTSVLDQNNQEVLKQWGPFVTDGLQYNLPKSRYRPMDRTHGGQLPPEGARDAGEEMLGILRELEKKHGPVYLPHQNYLGVLAGIKPGPSIDSIRDVSYTGRPTPRPLLERVEKHDLGRIVMMMPLQWEWLTADFHRAVQMNYQEAGPLMDPARGDLLMPRTGAQVRPSVFYEPRPITPPVNLDRMMRPPEGTPVP